MPKHAPACFSRPSPPLGPDLDCKIRSRARFSGDSADLALDSARPEARFAPEARAGSPERARLRPYAFGFAQSPGPPPADSLGSRPRAGPSPCRSCRMIAASGQSSARTAHHGCFKKKSRMANLPDSRRIRRCWGCTGLNGCPDRPCPRYLNRSCPIAVKAH